MADEVQGDRKPPVDRLVIDAKVIVIELHGRAAQLAIAAAATAGGYYLWRVKVPNRFVEVICASVTAVTGAIVERIGRGTLVLTLLAETSEIAQSVTDACQSGTLLAEINRAVSRYSSELQDDIGHFGPIQIISQQKEEMTPDDLQKRKEDVAQNLAFVVQNGLRCLESVKTEMHKTSTTSLEKDPEKIYYKEEWLIGEGMGSKVFMYSKESKLFAVKSMFLNSYPDANKEQETLCKLDGSKYLLKYIASKKTPDRLEIYTELCEGNVDEFIQCCQCKHKDLPEKEWPRPWQNQAEKISSGIKINKDYLSYFDLSPMDIAKQMIEGIYELHNLKQAFVHRDIKPSNFLLQKPSAYDSTFVKVCDFGLTRRIDSNWSQPSGTDSFKPPEVLACEQIRKEEERKTKPDKKSDVFSLGLTLYYTITEGKHPYGKNRIIQDPKILMGESPSMDDLNDMPLDEEIKINWCGLLQWMLQHDPKNRPTMKEVKCHPALWSYEEKIMFIQVVSNLTDEYRAQEKKQIKKVKKEERKKKALATKANPDQNVKKQKEVKDEKDFKLVTATCDEVEPEESVNRNPTHNDGAVTFSEPPTLQKQEAEPVDVPTTSNIQNASVSQSANRPRETPPCSFFDIKEVVDIDKRVKKLKEVFDPVNAPSSPVWKKINDIRNLNQHEQLRGRNRDIGLEEKTDWKKFYKHCTSGYSDLLLWIYALFGNMKQLENFMENVLQKDRGQSVSKQK